MCEEGTKEKPSPTYSAMNSNHVLPPRGHVVYTDLLVCHSFHILNLCQKLYLAEVFVKKPRANPESRNDYHGKKLSLFSFLIFSFIFRGYFF
jgi:hypothetical protein